MLKKLSIRMKLISLIVVVLTVGMTISSVITINLFKVEIKEILQEETKEKVAFLNTYLESYLATPISLVENTAENVEVTKDGALLHDQLKTRAESIEGILGLHVAFDGDPILYSSETLTLEPDYNSNTRDWYQEAKENAGQVVVTDPYVDAITGKLIVGVSKAMDNGQGVVTLDLDLAFLAELTASIKIGNSGYAFILDNEGNVLYHPSYEQNKSLVDIPFYDDFMANDYLETENNGEQVFMNRFYNEQMNWQIGSIYPYEDVRDAYVGLRLPVITVNAIFILITTFIFFFIIGRFLNPLRKVAEVAELVAQGNLKQRVVIRTEDEIGQLSGSFNNMTSGLKTMIHAVDDTSGKLSTFSLDVSASIEENVQSIYQVVEHIQTVANQSAEQLQATAQVQQVVHNMGDEVNHIASNMNEVKQASKEAEQHTNDGVAVMVHAKEQMQQIEASASQTENNFNELVSVANEIDKFSKVISGIADQTNLLALNASIEAARAGEHGKGFAVVADEVRKLAEQTNESANEIQALVTTIQKTGTIANESIASSNAAVLTGIAQIENASTMFNTIHDVMDTLLNRVNQTQAAITSLQQNKEEVISSVEEITSMTKQVSDSVEQVAATTQEQNASMEQMAVAAEQLSDQAQDLQDTIKRFEI